ncbi:hypothetical protein AAULR_01835, partial [Lacticaseibacillus rhamnosus MTCC 5462]
DEVLKVKRSETGSSLIRSSLLLTSLLVMQKR